MNITQALLGEHGVFYAQFKHLEQTLQMATNASQVQGQVTLLAAALETHARLENDLLFNALDAHLSGMGPLTVMRAEHQDIEGTLAQVAQVQDLSRAQGLVQRLLQIARAHFSKEEQVLFPLAEQTLDAATLQRLGAQWAEQRGVVVTQGAA